MTRSVAGPADHARHDRMVELVEWMLALHKHPAAVKTGHEKTLLQRQIDATDRQIDRLVCEPYGRTESVALANVRCLPRMPAPGGWAT